MADPYDDDLMIQASQLFNDAIAAQDLVYEFAEKLDLTYREYQDDDEKAVEILQPFKRKTWIIAQSAIVLAGDFQNALEKYRKTHPKSKRKKGFDEL